jgi:hypothetical protein
MEDKGVEDGGWVKLLCLSIDFFYKPPVENISIPSYKGFPESLYFYATSIPLRLSDSHAKESVPIYVPVLHPEPPRYL